MIVSIEGDEKTAKTTFLLTAPLPIVLFAFDIGQQRAISGAQWDKYFAGKDIYTVKYPKGYAKLDDIKPEWGNHDITIIELPSPIQLDTTRGTTGYVKLWQYFIYLLGEAASDDYVTTVGIDTMTIARRIKADAHLEELNDIAMREGKPPRKQLIQIEYGPINGAIENIYSVFATIGKTLITTHHLMDEYKPQMISGVMTEAPSGNKILEGWSKTYRAVDIAIRNELGKGNTITSKIVVCGPNISLQGVPISPPEWNSLVDLIAGGTGDRVQLPRRE